MDRGAWWATIHEATESQTLLSNWAHGLFFIYYQLGLTDSHQIKLIWVDSLSITTRILLKKNFWNSQEEIERFLGKALKRSIQLSHLQRCFLMLPLNPFQSTLGSSNPWRGGTVQTNGANKCPPGSSWSHQAGKAMGRQGASCYLQLTLPFVPLLKEQDCLPHSSPGVTDNPQAFSHLFLEPLMLNCILGSICFVHSVLWLKMILSSPDPFFNLLHQKSQKLWTKPTTPTVRFSQWWVTARNQKTRDSYWRYPFPQILP